MDQLRRRTAEIAAAYERLVASSDSRRSTRCLPDERLTPWPARALAKFELRSHTWRNGLTGRLSKHAPTWERINELHTQRFG